MKEGTERGSGRERKRERRREREGRPDGIFPSTLQIANIREEMICGKKPCVHPLLREFFFFIRGRVGMGASDAKAKDRGGRERSDHLYIYTMTEICRIRQLTAASQKVLSYHNGLGNIYR